MDIIEQLEGGASKDLVALRRAAAKEIRRLRKVESSAKLAIDAWQRGAEVNWPLTESMNRLRADVTGTEEH